MKKAILLSFTIIAVLSLVGCSQERSEPLSDFLINHWSSSIGAVDENSLDVFDEQRFSYTLFLTSETGILHEVKSVEPIFLDRVLERVISNKPPILFTKSDYDYIRIEGYIIFDSSGLTKEQIIHELDPFITAARITTEDGNEHVIDLRVWLR